MAGAMAGWMPPALSRRMGGGKHMRQSSQDLSGLQSHLPVFVETTSMQ